MSDALPFLLAFALGLALDLLPAASPPTWPFLVFLSVYFEVSPFAIAACGVLGMTLGRYVLLRYVVKLGDRFLGDAQRENVEFLGGKLKKSRRAALSFTFFMCMVPLSSTPFFTAAGMARIPPGHLLPAYAAAKLLAYSVLVYASDFAVHSAAEWRAMLVSWKGALGIVLSLGVLGAFLFVDWKLLVVEKRFALRFRSRPREER